jgi:WD40 repeat protein
MPETASSRSPRNFGPFCAARRACRSRTRTFVAAFALVAFVAPCAQAQVGGFGQNKIQYRRFDWHVLAGEHVDVFFYPEEERIARAALAYAEQSYDTLARRFGHEVRERIPLIVYASHVDFEQTNVLPFVPPEGILGVTEFLKRRVALPFRGSYSEFRHTLRHELVHVFELSILAREAALHPRARPPSIPLWWSEGLAEFLSAEQDSRDEMVVHDLVLGGRLPTLTELGPVVSPIVYALGGDAHRFLASEFGAWRMALVYDALWKSTSFGDALERAYGRDAARLSAEWHFELRRRHFPSVGTRRPLALVGTRLAPLALKPVAVEIADTTQVAYLSPRSGYTNIYLQSLHPEARARVVVEGERSPEFESLHPFSSRIDVRDGVLLFTSRFGERDALVFWDIAGERVTGRYRFDGLVSLLSPQWSPDGGRIAFSALSDSGVSDLYVLELQSGELKRVTADVYEDLDPTWLPHGRALVFSSDRGPHGANGARNLYRVELSGEISPLTTGAWADESPRWDARTSRILFTSDRAGAFDLYSIDTLGAGRRETSLTGGVFDAAPVPDDERVLVSAYADRSWSLYVLRKDPDEASSFTLQHAPLAEWRWRELDDSNATRVASRRYERRYSIDFAAGVAATAPGVGGAQGAQLVFSDLLGDHQFALSVSSFQGDASNVFGSLNGNLFYLNQSRRVNWGVGMFRVAGTFAESDLRQLYEEQSTGVYAVARYPLSRFTRIEGQTTLEYSNRDDFANDLVRGTPRRRGMLTGNYLVLVGDNALWLETGPIDGTRWNVTGGVVSDATHGAFENWLGQVDVRRYLRTSQQAAIALRALGYVSEGSRPRAIQLAGSWMLRGYPRYSLSGTHAWLANAEWRFPIANFVTVGFPFGAVRFPPVRGALFVDAGQAWNHSEYEERVLGSMGLGFRMSLVPGFVLRLDVGRRFVLAAVQESPADRGYFRRRFVDLFFGYDY